MAVNVKIFIRTVLLTVATAAAQQAHAQCSTPEFRMAELANFSKTSDSLILAHRGYWGKYNTDDPDTPENSLGALSWANVNCMDGVELDVKMTKDGVPVIMHDYNLGRTTDIHDRIGGAKYNPIANTGANPAVSDIPSNILLSTRLLKPDRGSNSIYTVPSVSGVMAYWRARAMKVPIFFDTKTSDAVRAMDAVAARSNIETLNVFGMKVNATLYPDPAAFYRDTRRFQVIPIYQTNMLGTISVATSLSKWMGPANTIEIDVKQRGGLLSFQKQQALNAGIRVGVFQAIPDGPGAGQFYRNTGQCCYRLSDIYYQHRINGNLAGEDTADDRGDMGFLVSEGFGLITTDDPRGTVAYLARAGKRRTHYQAFP